jgi:hypothetical protein
VSVRGIDGVRFTTRAGIATREERDLQHVQAALAPDDRFPSGETIGPHIALLDEGVILWVPIHVERARPRTSSSWATKSAPPIHLRSDRETTGSQ